MSSCGTGGRLATVAAISSAQLKSIQKQEGRCSTAEAALQAMAAGIEVLASDCAVQVGEQRLWLWANRKS